MSTFKGCVEEFPDIRIDYFRSDPEKREPLAFFLSHVHSDHLQGLDTSRGRFIYCSPATRVLLLRLEKYSHRMNFQKGILEATVRDYKALGKVLKTIPLNAPAKIELCPGYFIQVTLIDANHCAGAVMFLIEDSAKAILYTGDIRAELWWVNSLIRNPVMIPYKHGKFRRLDKIYLDTTFATTRSLYKDFPSKAEGISELLEQIVRYPHDTVFHFHAWTLGYEDVWVALSTALGCQIHVDDYKCRLYKPLAALGGKRENASHEGAALFGFPCGNHDQAGCLTHDESVRLHSCEFGTGCQALENTKTVMITPIITRSKDGDALHELGAGEGGGDLTRAHELDLSDSEAVTKLVDLCSLMEVEPLQRSKIMKFIFKALSSDSKKIPLDSVNCTDSVSLAEFEQLLAKLVHSSDRSTSVEDTTILSASGFGPLVRECECDPQNGLPKRILFPYSRHSSYDELCCFVDAFKPWDVYPCTTNEQTWTQDVSVESLFGQYCAGSSFAHDQEMTTLVIDRMSSLQSADPRKKGCRSLGDSSSQSCNINILSDDTIGIALSHQQTPEPKGSVHHLKRRRISGVLDPDQHRKIRGSPLPSSKSVADIRSLRFGFENELAHIEKHGTLPEPVSKHTSKSAIGATETKNPSVSWKSDAQAKFLETKQPTSSRTVKVAKLFSTGGTNECEPQTDRPGQMRRLPAETLAGCEEWTSEHSEYHDGDVIADETDIDASFLLADMPEPDKEHRQSESQRSGSETQISLSDAAFESQSSRIANDEVQSGTLRQRKEAYKAAKEQSGIWSVEFGLVSTGAGHRDEELEL